MAYINGNPILFAYSGTGGTSSSNSVKSMTVLDEREQNNQYIPFSDMYNRVYTHLSGGRGDYGRFCLTEGTTPPADPDGAVFERGNGKYFGVANNQVGYEGYTIDNLDGSQGWSLSYAPKSQCTIEVDDTNNGILAFKDVSCNSSSEAIFNNTGSTLKKCIFETEMLLNLRDLTWVKGTAEKEFWFVRVNFLTSDGSLIWANHPVRICCKADKSAAYFWQGNSSKVPIPLNEWFSFRVEQIGSEISVICNGLLVTTIENNAISDFGSVRFEMRSKTYVTGFTVKLDNTCVHSNNETIVGVTTLSSVAQRTKHGHLRVPAFVVGEEPTEDDISYLDEIAVPYKYVKSLREEIGRDISNHIPPLTENNVVLAEDLYAYTNIGKITASNTSPSKVGSVGDNLKAVFNKVFGTQQDAQPTITTSGVSLSVSPGTTSYGGGEYGTKVSATDVTITFTLNNSATAQYGYRCGTTKTPTTNAAFKYAITQQNSGDIKITLPSGKTASSSMVTAGTFVSASNNILYCNFNSSNKVSIKISLSADTVGTSSKERYGQIKGEVTLGQAQSTSGTTITKFLTYLGNDASDTSKLSGGTPSNTAGAYTINPGSYYAYSKLTDSTTAPTSGATKQTKADADNTYSYTSGQYLWLLSRSSGKKIQTYVAGSWADVNTSGGSSIALTLASGGTATYYAYRTDKFTANGSARYRLA